MPYLGNIPATQFAELKYQDFTGGTGTSFTLNDPVGSAQELEVFVNNVRQEPGVAYTVSGTTLTMTGSIVASDDFYVVFQGKSTGTATHPATQNLTAVDGTFTGDASVTGNATVTGNLTVDTNTLFVDSTNNHVAVGTTSPSTYTAFVSGSTSPGLVVAGTQAALVLVDTDISGNDGTLGITKGGEDTLINNLGNGSIKFFNNGAERAAFLADGGLTFNGDAGQVNALDDYEEGTFTPAPTVGTILLADAAYTKVGRKVTVHFNAYSFSDRSSTSHIEFTNLPFASDASIGSTANSGMHRYINAGDSLAFYIPRSQSKIQLFSLNSGSGWTPTQYSHLNSTASEMYVHLTYFTAS